jgi:hypothetical protein
VKQQQLENVGLKIRHSEYKFNRGLERVPSHPGVVLHHMGTGRFTGDLRHPGNIVHQMHLGNGWAGIGYHGIATQNGEYFTGRPYLNKGSHCPGRNEWFGLLWYGGTEDEPSLAARETLAKAIAWVAIDQGWKPSRQTIGFHGQTISTECPGNLKQWYNWIVDRAGVIYRAALNEQPQTPKRDTINIDVAGQTVQGIRREDLAYVPVRALTALGIVIEYEQAADLVRLKRGI